LDDHESQKQTFTTASPTYQLFHNSFTINALVDPIRVCTYLGEKALGRIWAENSKFGQSLHPLQEEVIRPSVQQQLLSLTQQGQNSGLNALVTMHCALMRTDNDACCRLCARPEVIRE